MPGRLELLKRGFPVLTQNCESAGNSEVILPVPAFAVIRDGYAGNRLVVKFVIPPSANFREVIH